MSDQPQEKPENIQTPTQARGKITAISLHQPWASLFVHGLKTVETRDYGTNHRGPLLIHAAMKFTKMQRRLCLNSPFKPALMKIGINPLSNTLGLPMGCIVGAVNITDSQKIIGKGPNFAYLADDSKIMEPDELAFGLYEAGRYAWRTASAIAFAAPIPFKGSQKFFGVDENLFSSGDHYKIWLESIMDSIERTAIREDQ